MTKTIIQIAIAIVIGVILITFGLGIANIFEEDKDKYYFVVIAETPKVYGSFSVTSNDVHRFVVKGRDPLSVELYLLDDWIPKETAKTKKDYTVHNIERIQ